MNAPQGMSTGEIVIAVLTVISIILAILKVWIQSQTDFAKLQTQHLSLQNELREHKQEDSERYERMRKENREDHGKLFDKIDEIKRKL